MNQTFIDLKSTLDSLQASPQIDTLYINRPYKVIEYERKKWNWEHTLGVTLYAIFTYIMIATI